MEIFGFFLESSLTIFSATLFAIIKKYGIAAAAAGAADGLRRQQEANRIHRYLHFKNVGIDSCRCSGCCCCWCCCSPEIGSAIGEMTSIFEKQIIVVKCESTASGAAPSDQCRSAPLLENVGLDLY